MVVLDYGGGPKPFASVFLRARKYRVFGTIRPFVDTGGPLTSLTPADVEKLHIPLNSLYGRTPRPSTHYIGGLSFWAYPMEDVTLAIRDENNKREEFILDSINVLKLTKNDRESIARAREIPSILGMDFITKNGFTLNFDPNNRIASLAKP